MPKVKHIPVHQMDNKSASGLQIFHFEPGFIPLDISAIGDHRDDHYIFFVIEKGSAALQVEFSELRIGENTLCYVLPGQVHRSINNHVTSGWFLAVDTHLVPADYRSVFENNLSLQKPVLLNIQQLSQCQAILNLLNQKCGEDSQPIPYHAPVVHALLKAFLGMAAGCYALANGTATRQSRPVQLTHQFKKLIAANIQTEKSPSAYAAMLNVSESYLNEALKKTTGFPVSYWILQEVLLEAKRMLYYTQLNVKQIAQSLGYPDPAYFSRLFSKAALVTPLAFRQQYRK